MRDRIVMVIIYMVVYLGFISNTKKPPISEWLHNYIISKIISQPVLQQEA